MSDSKSLPRQKIVINPQTAQRESVIRTIIDLPEPVFDRYAEQAMAVHHQPEQVISARLTRAVEWTGSGIYFNDLEKKQLEHLTGHALSDAQGALQWRSEEHTSE